MLRACIVFLTRLLATTQLDAHKLMSFMENVDAESVELRGRDSKLRILPFLGVPQGYLQQDRCEIQLTTRLWNSVWRVLDHGYDKCSCSVIATRSPRQSHQAL